ncbi:helix-turn-helix domain-containing protein [Neorhizobium alkalisoli]|uniref:AraC-like DNA-binding protein n=1 Tax=Neorhizobium alkalisoli TaxID=528178 RepID=A0A561R8E7_9HYPH|nr:AraC family transcriptional regulator [Neorhizobium alkalisoli]TWF58879.1 AraC-like DNA-binding protein [Neorhizobium alkalisoli]
MRIQDTVLDRAPALPIVTGDVDPRKYSGPVQSGSGSCFEAVSKPVPGGLAPWQIRRVAARIEERLSEKLSVDELAALAKLSPSYFAAAFRRSFGISPHAYIIARRVDHAKRQMLEDKIPLCQIALECGLADQAHLSRIFRRIEGITPTAWRQKHRYLAATRAAA